MSDRIKSSGSGGREAISRVDRGKVLAHRARTCNRAIRMGKPNLKLSSVPNHLHLRQREFELAASQGITELAPGQSFGRLLGLDEIYIFIKMSYITSDLLIIQ
ncbi:hypothetical protein G6F56_013628 [Rhizopus delemar]|nr:hypothetical protein G6F56_013628 [Rhizopus delemar]